MKPDFDTLRPIPWQEGTALVMADLQWEDGSEVVASPRQILRRQLARLAERGLIANAGTELEFMVFKNTYEDAWKRQYRDLDPANLYNVDYSLLGTARMEPLIRRIRNEMAGAGMEVENSKGECNFGQHEINFHYGEALRTADDHAIYKNGAKEIAHQEGMALTFMAKFNELEGNSCHIHCSLAHADGGENAFGDDETMFKRFVAGQIACMREFTLLFAPNVNSYKRFAKGSFAPTSVAWGRDNRTCSLRAVGHGPSLRIENRLPGADVNPYLALSAMIAAGLHGHRDRGRAGPADGGQRLRGRRPPGAAQHVRGAGAVRRQRGGARGIRPGGGRPLPQPRPGGAGHPRGGGHRLGSDPLASKGSDVTVVVGICAAIEQARWGAWDETVALVPLSYARTVQRAGGAGVRAAARRCRGGVARASCSTESTR